MRTALHSNRAIAVIAAFTVGALVLSTAPAAAQTEKTHKIDRALNEALKTGAPTQRVIVTVVPGARKAIRQALEQHGDKIKFEHGLVDALSVEIHSSDIDELSRHPMVRAIASDARIVASQDTSYTFTWDSTIPIVESNTTPPPTTLPLISTLRDTLGLPHIAGSSTMTGSTGVGVAILDSGIAPSPDFGGRITGFWDFTRGGIATNPFDDFGHGTHIAGLIGSSGGVSNYEYQGIAPNVHLIGVKVLNGNGEGTTSDVINALEFLVANKNRLNVQIVNLSFGHPIFAPANDDPLVQAVEKATAAGLIVVVAAGNAGKSQRTDGSGYTGLTSPGNAPSAITVGAANTKHTITRDDDEVAPYSSRGPSWYDARAKPDVVAPGHRLLSNTPLDSYLYSVLPNNRQNLNNGHALLRLSGTSMAAGVTSGVVALILEAHNRSGYHHQKPLTANLVKGILEFTAIPVGGTDYLTQGAGEVNAAGAIELASAINTGDSLDSYWLDSAVSGTSAIGDRQVAWGQNVIWGDAVLSGDLVYTNDIVWGTNIIWGTTTSWGPSVTLVADNIIWGTNVIWGTNIVWADRVLGEREGDNIIWGTATGDNIIWGTLTGDNIIWGTFQGDNIIWGTSQGDNIIWGTAAPEGVNIVWGTFLTTQDFDGIF